MQTRYKVNPAVLNELIETYRVLICCCFTKGLTENI